MIKINRETLDSSNLFKQVTRGGFLLVVVFFLSTVVLAQTTRKGPNAIIDSLSDAGDGKISISWSLEAPDDDTVFTNEHPDKVCAAWATVEDGSRGELTLDCFSEGMSTQSDLELDTGIGTNDETTEFSVSLRTYYDDMQMGPIGITYRWVNITLNTSN